jgi:hypothetical protein
MSKHATVRQLEAAVREVLKKSSLEAVKPMAAAGAGACIITRGGKTKTICKMLSANDCSAMHVWAQQQDPVEGKAVFLAGQKCK